MYVKAESTGKPFEYMCPHCGHEQRIVAHASLAVLTDRGGVFRCGNTECRCLFQLGSGPSKAAKPADPEPDPTYIHPGGDHYRC